MSNVNTTISINAVDNTASTFSKLEQNAGKVYQSILQQANKNAKLGQDTLKQIEKEVEAYKRKQQIQLEGQKAILRQELQQTYSKESISERRNSIRQQEKEDLASTIDVTERNKIKNKYQKINSSFDDDIRNEQQSAEKNLESTFKGFEEEQKNTNFLLKDMVESLKSDIFDKIENKTKKNITEDAKEALNPNVSLTEEEKSARLGAAKGATESSKEEKSAYEKIKTLATVAYVGHKVGQLANSVAGTQDPEHWFANALGGIPFIGPAIQTAMTRHIDEKLQQDKARNTLQGTTGKSGVGTMAGSLGMDLSEVLPIANAVALAQGSRGNLNKQTHNYIAGQKAFNLSDTSLSGALTANKFDINSNDISKTIGMVASILGTKSELINGGIDTTKLEALMQANNSLTEDQLTFLETTDQKATIGALKAFTSLGGRYSDPNVAKERMLQINSSLRNPKDDYQQARSFAVLSQLNPNASYLELQEQQEKGIYAKGYLSKILQMNEQQNGSGDMGILGLKNQFGFSAGQARMFMEGYKKDRTMFDNMDEEGIKTYLSQGDIMNRAGQNVTNLERDQAQISDAFAKSTLDGVVVALEKDINVAKEAFKSAGDAIEDFATKVMKTKFGFGSDDSGPNTKH